MVEYTTAVKAKILESLCSSNKAYEHASIIEVHGVRLLIDEVYVNGPDVCYTALGHTDLKSPKHHAVGILHETVRLVEQPSIKNWKLLVSARERMKVKS